MSDRSRFIGVVSDVDDPEKRGRIKVTSEEYIGDDGSEETGWIEPVVDYLMFAVPEVGELVEIEAVESGPDDWTDFQSSLFHSLYWTGLSPRSAEEGDFLSDTAKARPIAEAFKKNYPKRRGISTSGGHYLLFDDSQGSELIELMSPTGSTVALKNGDVTIDNGKGSTVVASGSKVEIKHTSGATITLKDGTITLDNGVLSEVSLDAAGVTLRGLELKVEVLGVEYNLGALLLFLSLPATNQAIGSAGPLDGLALLEGMAAALELP